MTVIAYRNGIIATDSLIAGSINLGDFTKGRSKNGWLTAVSGPVTEAQQYLDWFDNEFVKNKKPVFEDVPIGTEYGALLVSPKDEFYMIDAGGYFPFKPLQDFAAEGSGLHIALGVMYQGGTAIDAVEAAIKYVPNCGGHIQVYERK